MHHEIETLEDETAKLQAHSPHGLTLLSNIYLEAGLPLDLAARSAAADYALFEEEILCAQKSAHFQVSLPTYPTWT